MSELATLGLARAYEADQIARMSRDLIEVGLTWAWTPDRVRRHILDRNCSVVVARSEQHVVAFALMYFGDEIGHLNLLAVDPQWRRQYCGRRLMDWLLASAEVAGIKRIDLELRADNALAKAFYESVGFAPTTIKPRYYQGVESALGMRLTLLQD